LASLAAQSVAVDIEKHHLAVGGDSYHQGRHNREEQ
jgi:hypothetical protein